jgi:hypothetical protein
VAASRFAPTIPLVPACGTSRAVPTRTSISWATARLQLNPEMEGSRRSDTQSPDRNDVAHISGVGVWLRMASRQARRGSRYITGIPQGQTNSITIAVLNARLYLDPSQSAGTRITTLVNGICEETAVRVAAEGYQG